MTSINEHLANSESAKYFDESGFQIHKMPYFIQPSININSTLKKEAYKLLKANLEGELTDESSYLIKMATINSAIKRYIPYAYWVGFYCRSSKDKLSVGPYQGTHGCTSIKFGTGVCGRVALREESIIVDDTNKEIEGNTIITCDLNVQSEIVLPVWDSKKELIAVLDIDSTLLSSFDSIDEENLTAILNYHFSEKELGKTNLF